MGAVPVGIISVTIAIFGLTPNGLGVDVWGLQPQQLASFGRYFYMEQMFYIALMTLLKLALTLFYLSIFQTRGIRIVLWVTLVVYVLIGFGFTVIAIFQCTPISYQWRTFDPTNARRSLATALILMQPVGLTVR